MTDDTHGSPELDADAAKLAALGADPGPALGDLGLPADLVIVRLAHPDAGEHVFTTPSVDGPGDAEYLQAAIDEAVMRRGGDRAGWALAAGPDVGGLP